MSPIWTNLGFALKGPVVAFQVFVFLMFEMPNQRLLDVVMVHLCAYDLKAGVDTQLTLL